MEKTIFTRNEIQDIAAIENMTIDQLDLLACIGIHHVAGDGCIQEVIYIYS